MFKYLQEIFLLHQYRYCTNFNYSIGLMVDYIRVEKNNEQYFIVIFYQRSKLNIVEVYLIMFLKCI